MLVDATDFFLRDVVNVIPRLRPGTTASIGRAARSTCAWTKGFPKNTEITTILTFANEGGGCRRRARRRRTRRRRVRRRHVLGHGRQRHADGGCGHAARASQLRRAARRQLQAARGRSAIRIRRAAVRRLRRADDRAAREALHPAPSAREGRSRRPASARRRSRSSTTSIAARRSRSARRCSKGRAGGTRRSRPPATATPSRWSCCRKARTRWTSATT